MAQGEPEGQMRDHRVLSMSHQLRARYLEIFLCKSGLSSFNSIETKVTFMLESVKPEKKNDSSGIM